jgi:hypothetical protein
MRHAATLPVHPPTINPATEQISNPADADVFTMLQISSYQSASTPKGYPW